jgi:hypothetical protein
MDAQTILAIVAAVAILVLYYIFIVRRSAFKQYDYVKNLKIGDEPQYMGSKCKIVGKADNGRWIIEIEAYPMGFDSKHNLNWK